MSFIEISRHAKDITGHHFGRLKALWPAKKMIAKSGAISVHWMCGCNCGKMKIVTISDLVRKDGSGTKSCGCLNREHAHRMGKSWLRHGYSAKREYRIWVGMIERCFDKDHPAYKNYGNRGISICDRWLNGCDGKSGFECYVDDMGPRPSPKHSIDRINNNGNYEPENCRWATAKIQTNNMRVNRIVTAFGRTGTLASFTGGSKTRLYFLAFQRIVRWGWDTEKALTKETRKWRAQ